MKVDFSQKVDSLKIYETAQYFLDNVDKVISTFQSIAITNGYLSHSRESRETIRIIDELSFVNVCCIVYIDKKQSRLWQVSEQTRLNLIDFLNKFKEEEGSIELCRKIKIV